MSASIHFYLRTDRPNKDGSAPVYLMFTLTRTKRLKISTGKYICLKKEYRKISPEKLAELSSEEKDNLYCWDKKAERAIRGAANWEAINTYLDSQKYQANEAILKIQTLNRPLTIESFKQAFLKPSATDNFYEYFIREIEARKHKLAEGTYKGLKGQISKVNTYKPNLTLGDVDYKFLVSFEDYMLKPKKEKGLENLPCSVARTMKVVRSMLQIAIKNGDYPKEAYPFKDYKIKHFDPELTTRDYLEPDELLKLEQLLSPERIHELSIGEVKALKRFLFSCYTGLRFSDVLKLGRKEHIFNRWVQDPGTNQMVMRFYIEMRMGKTDQPIFIPLIDRALDLINESTSDQIFEHISNQKVNEHLKEINKKAKLNKKLSFHVARHSFATICFLYGIPEQVGQKLLGHKNRKFTAVYTHLSKNKLFYELEKVNTGLNSFALLLQNMDNKKNDMKEIMPLLNELSPDKLEQIKNLVKLLKTG